MIKKSFLLSILFSTAASSALSALPDNNIQGKLIFLGINHNSTQSVWLSLTNAPGSFQLEGPGQLLILHKTQKT